MDVPVLVMSGCYMFRFVVRGYFISGLWISFVLHVLVLEFWCLYMKLFACWLCDVMGIDWGMGSGMFLLLYICFDAFP